MLRRLINLFKSYSMKKEASLVKEPVTEQIIHSASNKDVKYYLNDPAFPELTGFTDNTPPFKLGINVKGFTGSGAPFDTLQGKAANVFGTLQQGINVINSRLNLDRWALVQTLNVDPLAGVQPNAYYDRQYLKFFYFTAPSTKKEVFTSLSADIINHEMGHAFLDAIRPEFFNMASMEVWAFHESFGDIVSIICALNHDAVLDILISQTGGDLRKSNIVEGVAEQFGLNLGMQSALRKAINDFVYVRPETLPQRAPDDQLAAECHSFSRVFTAAFYDIFCETVKSLGAVNKPNIKVAIDKLTGTFLDACKTSPAASNLFSVVATTWINILSANNPKITEIAKQCFTSRQIIGVAHAMNGDLKNYNVSKQLITSYGVGGMRYEKYKCETEISKLFEGEVINQSEKLNEIMSLKLSLPVDEFLKPQGMGFSNLCASVDEACDSAKYFINYLVNQDNYGDMENQSWYKKEGFLSRKYFACNCYSNNCLTPGNPEYGKCWKPKNNTGCCTYGSGANNDDKPTPAPVVNCNKRYNTSCGRINYNGRC
jgi:hypothetical protein